MGLYSKLRGAICNPREAILYIILGRVNYSTLTTKLEEILQCSQIRPQNPLEAGMLKITDVNEKAKRMGVKIGMSIEETAELMY